MKELIRQGSTFKLVVDTKAMWQIDFSGGNNTLKYYKNDEILLSNGAADVTLSVNGVDYEGVTYNDRDVLLPLLMAAVQNFAQTGGGVFQELPLSAFGDLRTAEMSPIFQSCFEYTVDNSEVHEHMNAGSGAVTQSDAMAVISTGVTTGSYGCLASNNHAKYRAGQGGLMRFTALFTAAVAGTDQLIGMATELGAGAIFKDGYMIGYVGEIFGFHRFVNDTLVTVAQADWDDPLDGTGRSLMTLDQTKLNVFEIKFQYLGGGAIDLYVENESTGKYILVHKILYANKNISPSVHNPNFHFLMYTGNGATTSDMILKTASYGYFIEGKTELILTHQPQFSTSTKQKAAVTTEVPILTIRNKAVYAGKNNFMDVILEAISLSIEAGTTNNLGIVKLVKNATLTGSPVWADIQATDSIMEIDVAATGYAGGKELMAFQLAGKNDKDNVNLVPYKNILKEGESITITGESAGSATIKALLLWKELI